MAIVIEEIIVELEDACRNFIYLAWFNQDGGITTLGFSYNQENALSTETGEEFQLNVTDLSTDNGVLDFVEKTGREVLTIRSENLSQEQIDYYRLIGVSPQVFMLNNSTSPYEWLKVLVEDGSIGTYQTDGNNFGLELVIRLPEIFTINN